MDFLLLIGLFWIIYGFLGLIGIQRIPERFKNRKITKAYKRSKGLGWLILGVTAFGVDRLLWYTTIPQWILLAVLLMVGLADIIYTFHMEKKFQIRLAEEIREERGKEE